MGEPEAQVNATKPLEGESAQDYHRFCVYRDLGTRRSLQEVALRSGLSVARVKQLSSHYAWRPRTAAWDAVARDKRRQRELTGARNGHSALLREALDWQSLARAGFAALVRRNEDGELELTRDLTPGEALRLWRSGCEGEQQLIGAIHGASAPSQKSPSESDMYRTVLKLCALEARHWLTVLGTRDDGEDELSAVCLRLYCSVAAAPGKCTVGPVDRAPAEIVGQSRREREALRAARDPGEHIV